MEVYDEQINISDRIYITPMVPMSLSRVGDLLPPFGSIVIA